LEEFFRSRFPFRVVGVFRGSFKGGRGLARSKSWREFFRSVTGIAIFWSREGRKTREKVGFFGECEGGSGHSKDF
jgi:hypothetical protein